MTRKLLVATHNPGKVREYQTLLAGLPLEVTYLDAEGITLEVEETGHTFAENAVLKATTYAHASGLWTWADDSGLEVDALGGAPGVYSSRYAGSGASDADRYRKLLDALTGVPWQQRTARFRCVVALATPAGDVQTVDGACEGIIAFGPAGSNGFGYDPVFYLPSRGLTMAQLPAEDKNETSHRGRAARAAETMLEAMLRG
jgi:XTP/dITP diphosphohydrolase